MPFSREKRKGARIPDVYAHFRWRSSQRQRDVILQTAQGACAFEDKTKSHVNPRLFNVRAVSRRRNPDDVSREFKKNFKTLEILQTSCSEAAQRSFFTACTEKEGFGPSPLPLVAAPFFPTSPRFLPSPPHHAIILTDENAQRRTQTQN